MKVNIQKLLRVDLDEEEARILLEILENKVDDRDLENGEEEFKDDLVKMLNRELD